MDERERFRLLSEIEEAAVGVRHSIFIMTICFVAFAITLMIGVFELVRLGLDARTIGWYGISAICYTLVRVNAPHPGKLEHYISLIREYNKSNDNDSDK